VFGFTKENIDLPAALLSRFDMVFLLLDTVDCDKEGHQKEWRITTNQENHRKGGKIR
jgi:DNA replicative helicase MCM subunit Mcm2 (Cdc46/Mcm family)